MVDIFTEFVSIIPLKINNAPSILEAMKVSITQMGGKPQTLYTDDEGALNTPLVQNYFLKIKISVFKHEAMKENGMQMKS